MAGDNFVLIDGIKGESDDDQYKDWIEVESFSWGVSQAASSVASTAGGASNARANFQDLTITKYLDASSPLLNKACWSGQHIKKVTLELNRSSGGDSLKFKYMVFVLENVIISNISIGGGGDQIPVESITFNYGKITTTYTKQARRGGGGAGEVPAGWNLQKNTQM